MFFTEKKCKCLNTFQKVVSSADTRAKAMPAIRGHTSEVQHVIHMELDFVSASKELTELLDVKLEDSNLRRIVLEEFSVGGREQNGFSRIDASPTDILRTLSRTPKKFIGILCRAHLRSRVVFLDRSVVHLLIKVR